MNETRFRAGDGPGGRRPRLLRHRADRRSLAVTIALLALLAGVLAGAVPPLAALPVTTLLCFSACAIMHNHGHLPMFRVRALNGLYSLLLTVLTAHTATGILTAHNVLHHRHLDSERDYVRSSHARFSRNWLNYLWFPFAAAWASRRHRRGDLAHWRRLRPALWRQAVLERVALWSAMAALLWLAPARYLAGALLPAALAQLLLIGINLLQHQGCDPASRYDHSRNVTGALGNWLLFNGGYHTAHHLRPGLHWSELPGFHRRIAGRIRPDLQEPGLGVALWRRLRAPAPGRFA